ncbi:MAG: glycosyltransferase [Nostoc sp. DedQUE04]|uniref:glycosyltransferase n=1 Tax=Nostoc sp. DedQUE04 TaxID=3075390 RepID=UPI002AD2CD3F|nr:glycosyltransferase [Nostoc sp. DedQUE04]MDZ8139571.1 glycosyltransferase [Nostoc sp. DedQUE04]
MTHFGILCPPSAGHLNPMTALGRELQRRGHRVTILGILDARCYVQAAGLEFWALAESEFPLGAIAKMLDQIGKMNGIAALVYSINAYKKSATVVLRTVPKALRESGVEALLLDETQLEGSTVAEFVQIPFVTVSCALTLYPEDKIPPFFTTWSYKQGWWALLRNQLAMSVLRRFAQPIQEVVNEYRRQWNLPLQYTSCEAYSKLAIISQQPIEFEFPRHKLPQHFHFTGPLYDDAGRQKVNFPYDKLNGKPLIYASLGTVQNQLQYIFHDIAKACEGLDAQLIISSGGALEPKTLSNLPGEPLVVKYAPQLELLKKASLTITHAGMNTTLESLSNGVPIVAIPIANDQPGVAARIAWTGTGEFVPVASVSVSKLRTAIKQVLAQDSFKQNALRLQTAIHRSGGISRAADIVEQAIVTGKPVLSHLKY